jgi:citrate lyase beta subunit
MTDSTTSRSTPDDDRWIDALLQARAPDPARLGRDEAFVAAVMHGVLAEPAAVEPAQALHRVQAIMARERRLRRWSMGAATLGLALGAWVLRGVDVTPWWVAADTSSWVAQLLGCACCAGVLVAMALQDRRL